MLMLLLRALTHSSNTSFTCVCVYHACVLCIVRGRERGKDGMVWGGVYLLGVNPTTRHVNAEMAIPPSPFSSSIRPLTSFSVFSAFSIYISCDCDLILSRKKKNRCISKVPLLQTKLWKFDFDFVRGLCYRRRSKREEERMIFGFWWNVKNDILKSFVKEQKTKFEHRKWL